jgi:hypothetical protein
MKILLAIVPFVFSTLNLSAQSQTVRRHLFNDKPKKINLFINPTFQFSQIAQQNCFIPGVRAGVIINKKIAIGGLYNLTLNDVPLPATKGGGKLRMQSEGFHFEYTLWPLQKVHLTIPISAGIGQMRITESLNKSMTGSPGFIFTEPGLMMEFNISKYVKFGFGASYRYTGNVSYNSLTNEDLSGFSIATSVKFGNFNYADRKKNKRDPLNTTESKTGKVSTPKSKFKIFHKRLTR